MLHSNLFIILLIIIIIIIIIIIWFVGAAYSIMACCNILNMDVMPCALFFDDMSDGCFPTNKLQV
jgi:hypothetical protein